MSDIAVTAPSKRGLTDREAGQMLGVSWRTVRRLAETDPTFPKPFRMGRCVRWDKSALERYLSRQGQ